ncbi:Aste57867_632 [Aphanomyces stellatus]|uniref:Aste57867_632 protein n=1 Tax=Aphanomyces stellatus TaxID=120398 RepID=A0A485K4A4_9STRA|nr:hypothetical protein As57867_000631 [Aphanomyces stellatus]VFT77857.1 Aste57867_632 [Aphanomyces stellatus]
MSSSKTGVSAAVQHQADAIARCDEAAVHHMQGKITSLPPREMEVIVGSACLSGVYSVFDRLVLHHWSAISPLLADPKRKDMRHHLVNLAVQGASVDIIKMMCRLTSLNVRDVVDRVPSSSSPGAVKIVTPILIASVGGHIDVVNYLIEQGVDVNMGSTREGNSPLGMATIHGHAMVVEALTAAGANTFHENIKGENIRALAAAYGQVDVLHSLPRPQQGAPGVYPPTNVNAVDEATMRRKIQNIRRSKGHTDYSLDARGGDVDLTPIQRRIALMKQRVETSRRNSLEGRRSQSPTSSEGESF